MDWRRVTALGVPGLGLGVFYKLYDKINLSFNDMPPFYIFSIAVIFLAFIAIIVFFSLYMWRPKSTETKPDGDISINIPNNARFKDVAEAIASTRLISFIGFTENELATTLQARQITASNAENLIQQLRLIATARIRPYTIKLSKTGTYLVKIK